jgi:hypothetical protein
MFLGAIVVITYSVQLLAYGYSRNKFLITDITMTIGSPADEALECQTSII